MSDSATPWTVPYLVSVSMGFSRQEYWSGLPFPSPGYLPDTGHETRSPGLQANSLPLSHQESNLRLLLSRFSRVRLCATP